MLKVKNFFTDTIGVAMIEDKPVQLVRIFVALRCKRTGKFVDLGWNFATLAANVIS